MQSFAYPVTAQILDDTVSVRRNEIVDGTSYLIEPVTFCCIFDAFKKALPGHFYEFSRLRRDLADSVGPGCIRMKPFIYQSGVQTYYIAFLKDMVPCRYPVNHLFINRYAYTCGISLIIKKIRNASPLSYELLPIFIDIGCGYSRPYKLSEFIMNFREQFAGYPHKFYFAVAFYRYLIKQSGCLPIL